MIVFVGVGEVICNQVSDAFVRKLAVDKVNRCLSRLALNIDRSDLLDTRKCLGTQIRTRCDWCCIERDQASDSGREELRKCHSCLAAYIMPNQSNLFKFSHINKTQQIISHIGICHTLMMVRLPMVSEINQKYISIAWDCIVKRKLPPHSTLSEQSMQKDNWGC